MSSVSENGGRRSASMGRRAELRSAACRKRKTALPAERRFEGVDEAAD